MELADLAQDESPDPAVRESLAASYGLFIDTGWVPERVETQGLRSPFG